MLTSTSKASLDFCPGSVMYLHYLCDNSQVRFWNLNKDDTSLDCSGNWKRQHINRHYTMESSSVRLGAQLFPLPSSKVRVKVTYSWSIYPLWERDWFLAEYPYVPLHFPATLQLVEAVWLIHVLFPDQST